MERKTEPRDEGFALLSAILALGVLLLLVSSMIVISASAVVRSGQSVYESQARAVADAILMQAVLALQDKRMEERPRVDGVVSELKVFGSIERVEIYDEFGKIDLNAAPQETLSKLFQTTGLSSVASDELAEGVEMWRQGLGEEQGSDSGGPPRRKFTLANQLMLVSGVTAALFERVEPAITVYSGREQVERSIASAQVLRALDGISPAEAEEIVASRAAAVDDDDPFALIHEGKVTLGADQRSWPFRIISHFSLGQGHQFLLDAVVRLTGSSHGGFLLMRYLLLPSATAQ